MKFLDRLTNKPEINNLKSLVEQQSQDLNNANRIIRNATLEVRQLKEAKEQWTSLSDSDDKRELEDADREKIRQKCIEIYYKTPEGKAIIKNLTNYIIGNGVNWTAQDENPAVQEFIDEFCSQPKVTFEKRQISIIKRTLRDGELFIHLISDAKGKTYAMRFYNPGQIKEIEKETGDAETVIKYQRTWRDDKSKEQKEDLPAGDIHHIRLEVDEDIDRGRPLLENVLTRIAQYEDWLDGRIKTNKAKSSIFLERIVEGSPGRVASVNAGFPGTSGGSFSEDEYSAQMPRYGTVVTHSKSVEWKWVIPNINAEDCKEDGRQIRLSIAAGVQLPEFVLTSDSSNANYSSTTVAESPFVKAIEAHRLFFEHELGSLFGKVIKKGIDGGLLPSTSTETVMKESARKQINRLKAAGVADLKEQINTLAKDDENFEERPIPTKTGVDFEWPSIITRNILEETQAVEMHRGMKICSRRTASMKLGYDPEEEDRIMEKESQEGGEEDAYAQMQGEIERLKAEITKNAAPPVP